MIRRTLIGALAALVYGVAAQAQPVLDVNAADPNDRSTVLDELVVTATPAGPAMWTATKGDSEVVILGAVSPLPHQPPWDTRRLELQLSDAREVLLPPMGRVSPVQAVSMALSRNRLKMPKGQSLELSLPEPLRTRYIQTLGVFRLDQRKYDDWKPGAAGFLMLSDMRENAGLSSAKPGSTVARMAKQHRAPVRIVGGSSVAKLFDNAKVLTQAEHERCLAMALDEMDREAALARPIADAWSRGDLETVRRGYPAPVLEACLMQMPSYRALVGEGVDAAVAELEKALTKPGRAVAVIDLNFLLRRNGVLDRLKASGAEITAPYD